VEERFPEEAARWEKDPFTFAPEGGESGLAVTARALPFCLNSSGKNSGQSILVVSHKATIRLLIARSSVFDPRRYRDNLDLKPASLSIVDFKDPSAARLMLFNDHFALLGFARDAARAVVENVE